MLVDSDSLVSITMANQNFSQVARLADKHKRVVIMKNNVPAYVLQDFHAVDEAEKLEQEIADVSDALMKKNAYVYDKLSQ